MIVYNVSKPPLTSSRPMLGRTLPGEQKQQMLVERDLSPAHQASLDIEILLKSFFELGAVVRVEDPGAKLH